MEFWTVQFREYLEFSNVKEQLKGVKKLKKAETESEYLRYGILVEDTITKILSDSKELTVKTLSPQMDIGFGADIQVSYMEGEKNFSFFMDITSTQKKMVEYLTHTGSMTSDIQEAFCYNTEYFNVRFGLKERHVNHFFYEKPVVVMYIQNFVPCTGIAIHHINNITNIIKSLNALLVDMGYGARASQKVRPNKHRFMEDFMKMKHNKKGGF